MIPTRGQLLELLRLCHWPRLRLTRFVLDGEEAWARALPLLVPTDRQRIAGRLRWALLRATAAGGEKLDAYLATRRQRETEEARYLRYGTEAKIYGDVALESPILCGLVRLPCPVGDYCAQTCMFITTGRRWAGWTGGPLPPDRLPVVLDGTRLNECLVKTVVHECAHVWLRPSVAGCENLTMCEQSYRATVGPDAPAFRAAVDDEERLVRLVTSAWLCGATAHRASNALLVASGQGG